MELKPFEVPTTDEKLAEILNTSIPAKYVKENNGVKYVPISYVRAMLDSIYPGWSFQLTKNELVLNSWVCELELTVTNQFTGAKRVVPGVSGVPIQLKKGSQPLDAQNLQHFSLQKAIPAAKSYALKNAAYELGTVFGRDVATDFSYDYEADFTPLTERVQNESFRLDIKDQLQQAQTLSDLNEIYRAAIEQKQWNNEYSKLFTIRKKELQKALK